MVGYIITLNGNTIYSDGINAPHAAGSTISLSAPNTDGVMTNGTYHVYQRILGESAYENDFVLNYTIPANTLSLTIDGYSSTVVCRDSTLYTGLTVSNYLLTHSQPTVGDTTSLTTPFTIPPTIYAGTHTLSLVADILWTGTLVTLEDRLTYSTTDTAYLLDENTIMDAVDAYKASYRLNLVNNKSEARNQRAIIADIDLYEDDYWVAVRRYDKLTAYTSLLKIYDLLNETLVSVGEITVYESINDRIDTVESDVASYDGRISDIEDSISTIEQTAEDAQTAVSNHINATTAHSISQVDGLQSALDGKSPSSHAHAISDVSGLQTALNGKAPSSHTHVTDSTLTGEGTASSPLGVNVSSFYNTLSGDVTISLGTFNQPERSNAVSTISSLLITNANFKGATLIPMVTSDHEDLDEHAVERVNFMVENIVDNTSFDIRIFAPDGSWGNYKYKYIITY